jgi:hypothetical protein
MSGTPYIVMRKNEEKGKSRGRKHGTKRKLDFVNEASVVELCPKTNNMKTGILSIL